MITQMLPLPDWYRHKPLVFAHRGASFDAPENTMAAFRLAHEMGADGVELDTLLTLDDIPVVIHDFTLEKTTDGTGKVRDKLLRDLKRLDAGSHYDFSFRTERIPTLDETLEFFAKTGMLVNIELKSVGWRHSLLESLTLGAIRKHNMQSRVIISSFNPFALRRFHHLAPNIPLGYLYAPEVPTWLRFFMLGVPHQARHPEQRMIDAAYMTWAQKQGYRVNTWTVDDPERALALRDLGVDAIITNRPDLLIKTLDRNKTRTEGGAIKGLS